MDINFGIVLPSHIAASQFTPNPLVTREFGGSVHTIDSQTMHFRRFIKPEIRIYDLTEPLRFRLAERFSSSDWKYAWLNSECLDEHQRALRLEFEEACQLPTIGSLPLEEMLIDLLNSLDDWAVVFARDCEFIDSTCEASVAEVLDLIRSNLLSPNGPSGFLATRTTCTQ